MDIDLKRQWVASALGMTLAEVMEAEKRGGIEWKPLEFEAKGYIDPREEEGNPVTPEYQRRFLEKLEAMVADGLPIRVRMVMGKA